MAIMEKRKTGTILPRTYGILLDMPGFATFVSPMQYVLAQLAFETVSEIQERVGDWAVGHGSGLENALKALEVGVLEIEGTKNILTHSRRTLTRQASDLTLRKVRHYGSKFDAEVKSRGDFRDNEGYRKVSLREPPKIQEVVIGYPDNTCSCPDHHYGSFKRKRLNPVCMHVAVSEIALSIDTRFDAPQHGNMTGLLPRQRLMNSPLPALPFTFNFFKEPQSRSEEEQLVWRLATDAIMKYYTQGESQYQLDIELLNNPTIYSKALINAIQGPNDRARFEVLRQKEEEFPIEKLTARQNARHASVTGMLKDIYSYIIKKHSCFPAGLCREFVGTLWETVARRFEPRGRGPVYSVVVSEQHPPIIVARLLGEKTPDWHESYDPVQTDHLAEKIGLGRYSIVDDVTRRTSNVQLRLPDKALRGFGCHIPENLRREYDELRARMK